MATITVTPTEQLGKIVKNLIKTCFSRSPCIGLITSDETMPNIFTYVLYGLLLNIANKNVEQDKKVNT